MPQTQSTNNNILPTFFVPHGSPPLPIDPCESADFLKAFETHVPHPVSAILFISPHFETETFTVTSTLTPQTLYDFDPGTNPVAVERLSKLVYPAPGAPELASRVQKLIQQAGFQCALDDERGLDHGTWVPLYLMYPTHNIPIVQLSITSDLNIHNHIAVGRALSVLRSEGVLIIGSGEVVHNVDYIYPKTNPPQQFCLDFERWLDESLAVTEPDRRDELFYSFMKQPFSQMAHPREEHILPFFVAFGAAGSQCIGKRIHESYLGSLSMAGYSFT